MPELLIELFSEEIPARMQARAADDLARLVAEALAPLAPAGVQTFHGPRRVALVATLDAAVPATATEERGPRLTAPEAALAGFLRKHGAAREDLVQDGNHWTLRRSAPAVEAAGLVAAALPPLLRRFPWPKSMRWGRGSHFTWVRPLRRILCLLGGQVVPFDLRDAADDGHGLAAGDATEGHRFHAPGAFAVAGFAEWREGLRARRVIVEADERRRLVAEGVAALAAAHGVDEDAACTALLHALTANLVSAAVRLVPLGQTAGLRTLAALEPAVHEVAEDTRAAGLDDLGGACFRSDIASLRHETQYTRLFRS